jgi:hypothetical protein
MLDTGYWMLDAGYWMLDTGYSLINTKFANKRLKPDEFNFLRIHQLNYGG